MDTLIIFDFDWSLIDCNSDTWVVDKLGAMERMKPLMEVLPWTQLMVILQSGFRNPRFPLMEKYQCGVCI